jgi:hypothetical protein
MITWHKISDIPPPRSGRILLWDATRAGEEAEVVEWCDIVNAWVYVGEYAFDNATHWALITPPQD